MSGILHIRIVCRRKGKKSEKVKILNSILLFAVVFFLFFLRYCNSFSNLLLLRSFMCLVVVAVIILHCRSSIIVIFHFLSQSHNRILFLISFYFPFSLKLLLLLLSSWTSFSLHKDRGISKIIIFVFLHSTFDVHAIISAVIEFNSTKSIEATTTTTDHEHNYLSYDKWKHNLNVQLQDLLWKLFTLQSLLYFSLFSSIFWHVEK